MADIHSSEANFVVNDGQFLWKVDIIMEDAKPGSSLADRFVDGSPQYVTDAEFPYENHQLSQIVYALITGVIVTGF